jgi:choice-of-anchor A domain-containing protein
MTVTMSIRTKLMVMATFLVSSGSAAPILVTDFNLVVGGNLYSTSEVEGRTLVGGNLSGPASNYAVALTPSASFSDIDTLIVGGNITAGAINVAAGDIRAGGTASGIVNRNGVGSELFQNDAMVGGTITSALSAVNGLSGYLSSLPVTSSVNNPPGPSAVTFNALAGPGNVAVFTLDGSLFSDPLSQQYDLTLGRAVDFVIFNVTGDSINVNQGNFVGAFTNLPLRPGLIWNFTQASSIQLDRNWFGAIVAPHASLTNSSAIDGSVFIGGNFTQLGELHLPNYGGPRGDTSVPEPATIWLIAGGIGMAGICKWRRARA